jgi:hypothetical protein
LRDEATDSNGGLALLISKRRLDSYAAAPPPGHEGPCTLQISANRRSAFWGIVACFILAFLCLAGGIYQTRLLLHLTIEGKRADAVVVGIDVGARGSKRAVLQFVTDTGSTAVSRDQFQMLVYRFHKGDHVTAWYDPADPGIVTIDLGLWTWQQPVFFYLGFVLLGILGLLLPRLKPAHNK